MTTSVKELVQLPFFRELSTSCLNQLAVITSPRTHYLRDDYIYTPASNNRLLIFSQGKAKVTALTASGNEKVLYTVSAGMIDGAANLFSTTPIAKYMQALDDVDIYSIKHCDLRRLLLTSPILSSQLVTALGKWTLKFEEYLSKRDSLPAQERVYSVLLNYQAQFPHHQFQLPLSKHDLANFIGITPETLSRQLKLLTIKGKIVVTGNTIQVIN